MTKSRTQRYRLTHEFVLRDRGDYANAIRLFQLALKNVIEAMGEHRMQSNYLAVEKVVDDG